MTWEESCGGGAQMRGSEAPRGEGAAVEEWNDATESGGRDRHDSGLKMSILQAFKRHRNGGVGFQCHNRVRGFRKRSPTFAG